LINDDEGGLLFFLADKTAPTGEESENWGFAEETKRIGREHIILPMA
jgi:hypothetical protein